MDAVTPLSPAINPIAPVQGSPAETRAAGPPGSAAAPSAPEPGVVASFSGKAQLPVSAASLYQILAAAWEQQDSGTASTIGS